MNEPTAVTIEPRTSSGTRHPVRFPHGLGDCVYFAHQLPLYTRRGFEIDVVCPPDMEPLFQACGVEVDGWSRESHNG